MQPVATEKAFIYSLNSFGTLFPSISLLLRLILGSSTGCFDGIDSPIIEGYGVCKCSFACQASTNSSSLFRSVKSRTESVSLRYPLDQSGKEARGRSFHHGRFVMKLRQAAAKSPKYGVLISCLLFLTVYLVSVTIVHAVAINLIENESMGSIEGVEVRVGRGDLASDFFDHHPAYTTIDPNAPSKRERVYLLPYTISHLVIGVKYFAPLTIVCDGCASNLRKQVIQRKTEVFYKLIRIST